MYKKRYAVTYTLVELEADISQFNLLYDKLVAAGSGDKPVDLLSAFRSTSLDIISAFCFAHSLDSLEVEGFRSPLLVAMEMASGSFRFAKHFPRLNRLIVNSPRWIAVLLSPTMTAFFDVRKVCVLSYSHRYHD